MANNIIEKYLLRLIDYRTKLKSEISKSSDFIPYIIGLHGASDRSLRRSLKSKEDLFAIKQYHKEILEFLKKFNSETNPDLIEQYKIEYKLKREIMSKKILDIDIDFSIYITFIEKMKENKPQFFETTLGRKINLVYANYIKLIPFLQESLLKLINHKVKIELEKNDMGSDYERVSNYIMQEINWDKIFGNIKETNWKLSTYVVPYIDNTISKYVEMYKTEQEQAPSDIAIDAAGKAIVVNDMEED